VTVGLTMGRGVVSGAVVGAAGAVGALGASQAAISSVSIIKVNSLIRRGLNIPILLVRIGAIIA
jgi:hypothetical protein